MPGAGSAVYRRLARRAARRYGLDPGVFSRQIQQESGFNPHISSPAGAQGIAQIMPETARAWGVDPNNPRQALFAAAKNMAQYVKKYGGYENALRAYNAGPGAIERSKGFAETNNYVKTILGGRDPGSLRPARGGGTQPAVPGTPGSVIDFGGGGVRGVSDGGVDVLSLLKSLTAQPPAVGGSSVPLPAFAAQAAMPATYQPPPSGGGPSPQPDVTDLLAQIQTQGQAVDMSTPGGGSLVIPGTPGIPGTGQLPVNVGGRNGRVVVSPGADRAGVSTKPFVIQALRRVSAISGSPVRIGTGTNHSRMTVNGNVSDHWGGEAADVPATGKRLIRLGQAALIDAGMDPKEARKQTGGLYTLPNGAQIIFNTHEGGDHTNHLHYHPARKRR